MVKRSFDCLLKAFRIDVKTRQRRIVLYQSRIAHAVNQFAAYARVKRSDQTQPQTGEARRQDRNGDHPTVKAALACVFLHDLAVADLVGASDLKDLTLLLGQS